MELPILSTANQEIGKKQMPSQFNDVVRPDIIKRAVLTLQSNARQPYGAKPEAGKRASAELSRRRHKYRGAYGYGVSRVPRKILSRRGTRMYWVGAFAPGTVGGRRAHPPKAEKDWKQKINKKENRKAIRSCLAATLSREWVEKRETSLPARYPFVVEHKLEKIKTTKQLRSVLHSYGLEKISSGRKKIRQGKGKMRGRTYKSKRGLLIVVSESCPVEKSAANLVGVEVVHIDKINAELLAPGGQPGRLTLYTEGSIDKLEKERLFAK